MVPAGDAPVGRGWWGGGVQPRTPGTSRGPRQPIRERSGLGAEPTAAVAAARRRALRDGDRQIDTAHLLHSLLDHDPQVCALFDGPQLARLLGYLVQRSIGYGLRWRGGVEDSGALPVVGPNAPPVEGLSPLAAVALERAGARAARRDGGPARGADLLAAIVDDPRARAVEVLTRAGVDVPALRTRLGDGPQEPTGE